MFCGPAVSAASQLNIFGKTEQRVCVRLCVTPEHVECNSLHTFYVLAGCPYLLHEKHGASHGQSS